MAVQSISNAVLYKSLMSNINNVKERIATEQMQISSGNVVNRYQDLANTGKSEGIINMESKLNSIDSYLTTNEITKDRLQAMDAALSTIIDSLFEYRSVIVKRRSAVGTSPAIQQTVNQVGEATLAVIQDSLNTRYEGQFVFAGAKIDTAPVFNIVDNTNILNEQVTSNYYRGDAVTRSARVSDSLVIDYGIKADDKGFQYAVAAIHQTIAATNDQGVSKAFDYISTAIDDIINIRTKVRNSMAQIEEVNQVFSNIKVYFTQSLADTMKTKIEEVSIQLSNDMTILMGSFQAFGMVSKLNLADYLR